MTQPDHIQAYWQAFLDSLKNEVHLAVYEAWSFGDSAEMADRLGALVKAGIKTATAGLAWEYEHDGVSLPQAGGYSVILDGAGMPLCIIQTTDVSLKPFQEVDAQFAYDEGEGDRSLAYWRQVHWQFFSRVCSAINRLPQEDMPVVCERFRLVYGLDK